MALVVFQYNTYLMWEEYEMGWEKRYWEMERMKKRGEMGRKKKQGKMLEKKEMRGTSERG